ncbi:MAG: AIM24 family protein [Firmicutes bacterium]|nr:AIM24 family protein [Bacillota bacterium]
MIRTNLLSNSPNHTIINKLGSFSVIEYEKDMSVSPEQAHTAYFASKMNIRKRQVVAKLEGNDVILQSGGMQMMIGKIEASTNVKGAGDLMKKFVGSKVTGETAIKPRYTGYGYLVLEPTYNYILLEDLRNWNGGMVTLDGLFLACDGTVESKVTTRKTISSAVLGDSGFFSNALVGKGVVALESPVPQDELIIVDMEDDVLKIDGNMAIAWSNSLKFTVERTTSTLIGSSVSGEGLVNTYRGTGRVLIAPIQKNCNITSPAKDVQAQQLVEEHPDHYYKHEYDE